MNHALPHSSFPALKLDLSGSLWIIRAGDADAIPVVAALGKAMSLPPAGNLPRQPATGRWRELCVLTDSRQSAPLGEYDQTGPVFCILPLPDTSERLVIGMSLTALAIARSELARGGLLIHGALAEAPDRKGGGGIILAGPAEVGKTTASNRLPPPWRSLSDDTTLVVQNRSGQYVAHPWPTWSRFFGSEGGNSGPGGTWEVQEGLPLRSIFFLMQAKEDRIKALPVASAVTYLMETVKLVSSLMTRDLSSEGMQTLHKNQLGAAERLIRTIPAYILQLSLTGTFWNNIEETLSRDSRTNPSEEECSCSAWTDSHHEREGVHAPRDNNTITVCYSGPSMKPTLRGTDILEVLPYSGKPVRRGDIVYYPSPIDGQRTLHRVVRLSKDWIYTRGDNNTEEDCYVLQQKDIIGRAVAAWHSGRRRSIAGGILGSWSGCSAVVYNQVDRYFTPKLHGTYRALASGLRCLLRSVLPASLRPRVIEFKQRYQPPLLKLIVSGHVIGQYDSCRNRWMINRPWRLVVDESKLPTAMERPFENQSSMKNAFANGEALSSKAK